MNSATPIKVVAVSLASDPGQPRLLVRLSAVPVPHPLPLRRKADPSRLAYALGGERPIELGRDW